jgi:hypothetical protein
MHFSLLNEHLKNRPQLSFLFCSACLERGGAVPHARCGRKESESVPAGIPPSSPPRASVVTGRRGRRPHCPPRGPCEVEPGEDPIRLVCQRHRGSEPPLSARTREGARRPGWLPDAGPRRGPPARARVRTGPRPEADRRAARLRVAPHPGHPEQQRRPGALAGGGVAAASCVPPAASVGVSVLPPLAPLPPSPALAPPPRPPPLQRRWRGSGRPMPPPAPPPRLRRQLRVRRRTGSRLRCSRRWRWPGNRRR